MRLRNTFLLTVILPLFASLFLLSALSVWALEENARARLQNEVELIARALRVPLSYAMAGHERQAIRNSLSSAFSFKRIYGAYVFDTRGQRIVGMGLGGQAFHRARIAEVASSGEETAQHTEVNGFSYYAYLVPLTSRQGEVIGVLQVNRAESGLESYFNRVTLIAIIAFITAIGWVLFLVWRGFRRYIEQPLNLLHDSMQRIKYGERAHRARATGSHEFVQLSHGFNDMLDSIDSKNAEVQQRQQKALELERELRQSRKLAEIGVLAAGVAHELGSPLSVIRGQAQRLMNRSEQSDRSQRPERIIREVDRMSAIVRQLINLGRQHNLNRHDSSLDAMLNDTLELLEEEIHSHGVTVESDIRTPDRDLLMHVDRERFQQILVNLTKNAVQAAPGGRVTIVAERAAELAEIHIEDSGAGIAEAHRSRLFDPFFTTKSVGNGSGLGLSVAHRIAEDHGGVIRIGESALGGARFTIRIPCPLPPPAGNTP